MLITIAAGCVVWTVLYVLLILAAMVFNSGIGSPLCYPIGIGLLILMPILFGWGLFTPACAVGAWVRFRFKWPNIASFPIALVSAFLWSYLLYGIGMKCFTEDGFPLSLTLLRHFFIYLSLPFSLYWLLTEGAAALLEMGYRRIKHRYFKKAAPISPKAI